MDKKVILAICVLMCLWAAVSSAEKGKKRGIIVKCQGNPVSCYGKRSPSPQMDDMDNDGLQIDDDAVSSQEEANYEYLAKLKRNCKLGVERSCATLLRIMIINSSQ